MEDKVDLEDNKSQPLLALQIWEVRTVLVVGLDKDRAIHLVHDQGSNNNHTDRVAT
jgi:hypothetical protein